VVLVGMGDNNAKERRIGCLGSAYWGQRGCFRGCGIKRQADIYDDTFAPRFNLNAGAPDLFRSPMYTNPHRAPSTRLSTQQLFLLPQAAGKR